MPVPEASLSPPASPCSTGGETADIFDVSGTFLADNTPAPVQMPDYIGPYKVLKPLGKGGMSRVYLAEHLAMHRQVALKVLPAHMASDPGSLERFYREARAAAALDHPNIVRAFDVCSSAGYHCLVMEYVPGRDLEVIIRERGPLPVHEAVDYVCKAAIGLQHAFEKGIVHRDIKPSNLLLENDGGVKLLDLGLARFHRDQTDKLTDEFDDGALFCTPDYVAPEQVAKGVDVDSRADIYALGGTLYSLLTGKPPFSGSVAQKLVLHQSKDPTPLNRLRSDVPKELAAIVRRMMAKDRKRRFQTPNDVITALEAWRRPVQKRAGTEKLPDGSAETRKLFAASWENLSGPVDSVLSPRGTKVLTSQANSSSSRARKAAVIACAITAVLITSVLVGVRWFPKNPSPDVAKGQISAKR